MDDTQYKNLLAVLEHTRQSLFPLNNAECLIIGKGKENHLDGDIRMTNVTYSVGVNGNTVEHIASGRLSNKQYFVWKYGYTVNSDGLWDNLTNTIFLSDKIDNIVDYFGI